ncbi:hypothetical protein DFH07DRAFT_941933 [Mycena maculata]|uniref:Uncharacterized protein n=1 Tax=Mycena maculata TaxID=230809 RepID=A0AAD7IW98_9AGAR|nr:hypothetical protein DFH07DRAFT_941933 [Mycena maculata]
MTARHYFLLAEPRHPIALGCTRAAFLGENVIWAVMKRLPSAIAEANQVRINNELRARRLCKSSQLSGLTLYEIATTAIAWYSLPRRILQQYSLLLATARITSREHSKNCFEPTMIDLLARYRVPLILTEGWRQLIGKCERRKEEGRKALPTYVGTAGCPDMSQPLADYHVPPACRIVPPVDQSPVLIHRHGWIESYGVMQSYGSSLPKPVENLPKIHGVMTVLG